MKQGGLVLVLEVLFLMGGSWGWILGATVMSRTGSLARVDASPLP